MQYIVPMPKTALSMVTILDKWWLANEEKTDLNSLR